MKLNKKILGFDLVIQTLIIWMACLLLLVAVFSPYIIFYYLMLQLAIGFWQVLSAFIIVMITGNKKRIQYLVSVFAYFINLGLFTYFLKEINFDTTFAQIIIWIVIPAIYALWYFRVTYRDAKKEGEIVADSMVENRIRRNIWRKKEYV